MSWMKTILIVTAIAFAGWCSLYMAFEIQKAIVVQTFLAQ